MTSFPLPLVPCVLVIAVHAGGVHAAGSVGPAGAVYKCRGERGIPVYQEAPCAPGRELRDFAADPPPVSVIPFEHGTAAPAPAPAPARAARERPSSATKAGDAAARAEERRHVRAGMTEAEVRARIGQPDMSSGKAATARWSYLPAPGDPSTITTLHLQNGRVVSVERSVVR